MIDALGPGSRERRLLTAILVLGTVVLFFAAVEPGRGRDRLLRRHPPHVLPGLAARLHHQPDRHPDRRRDPTIAARAGHGPRLQRDRRAPGVPRAGRGAGAVELDHAVRRLTPAGPRRHRHDPRPAAGLARRHRAGSGRSRGPGPGDPRQPRRDRGPVDRPAPVDRGRQRRGHRDDAHRVHPVDLHGRRPRRDPGVHLPARPAELRGRGSAAADVGRAVVRRVPARSGADGHRVFPGRDGDQPAPGPAARGPDRRPPPAC